MSNQKLFIDNFLERIGEDYYSNLIGKPRDDMAWEILGISMVLNKNFRQVWDSIVIRSRGEIRATGADGGFDGIYFEIDGDIGTMHVFQCKNQVNLVDKQIEKFKNDVRDIFTDGNYEDKLNIELIMPQIEQYKSLTKAGFMIETKKYYLFNGEKEHANNKEIYDAKHNPDDGFYILDASDLFHVIFQQATKKRQEVKFKFRPIMSNIASAVGDPQSLYTFYIENIKAANFRLAALDLCNLIDTEIEINGTYKTLFQENIRGYLGMTSKANENIRATIKNPYDSRLFPFLNNGITIICDRLTISNKQQNNYIVEVVNPQIVNGLQTSMVIYTSYDQGKFDLSFLNDISLNVRVYQVTDQSVIDRITDATNTQTPINFRDKLSTKEFNLHTEKLFENAGIAYISKREISFSAKNAKKHTVESETVMKSWYATFNENPVISKNNMAKVTQDIFEACSSPNHELNYLFNGSQESPIYGQFLASYKIYSYVTSKRNEVKNQFDFADHVDELVCYGIYRYFDGELEKFNKIENISEAYQISLETIKSIIEAERDRGRLIEYSLYFKSQKCKKDYDNILNRRIGTISQQQKLW